MKVLLIVLYGIVQAEDEVQQIVQKLDLGQEEKSIKVKEELESTLDRIEKTVDMTL